ncbi:hypothetical protein Pan153_08420 [Gimesia panareensis]|uniref:DUF4419 domain-containing protein n=1 Tax=Gimesia panareensis TaxID=2527978 RepID=A0A518FIP3_9PLAN|nr:DUF4419 domain-containing protein [Gimesia panareensis]QDV16221.1 hypothetical protein Pan153_08420 [Gimesia panareensis]
MTNTTFPVSPDVTPKTPLEKVDYVGKLRVALRRPIEATWLPREPLVACDDKHALLTAMKLSFYDHFPLRLSPDAIWITLARGFALHVNENADTLRHRFVSHAGKEELKIRRMDFMPGDDNPWPEVFDEFNDQIAERTGGLSELIQADFSTSGPVERAVSNLMAMETFKSYFEYTSYIGCGTPSITLTGTIADWEKLRLRVQRFADYGLEEWIGALDPILAEFVNAKKGQVQTDFWRSMFRYNSGSGFAVLTGWANVLFPYFNEDGSEKLYPNPFLSDWQERLNIDDQQDWTKRGWDPQGVGLAEIPSCFTSIPLTVFLGAEETKMRLVGGLLGVSQNNDSLEVEPECGWVLVYEEPVDPLPDKFQWLERYTESEEN